MSEDKRRQRILGQARADLTELPTMIDTLSRQLFNTGNGEGGTGKITGSPALIRLDILAIIDPTRKPGWDGDDPRLVQLGERYGAAATLESWTRVVFEEIPEDDRPEFAETPTVRSEASVLLEVWEWITRQDWANELAEDVTDLAKRCRTALGVRAEYRPRCRYCRNRVVPVDSGTQAETSWEACAYGLCRGCGATFPPGPALTALGQVQDPEPLDRIAEALGLPLRTVQRWVTSGVVKPAPDSEGKRRGRLFDLAEVRVAATHLNRPIP